MSATTFLQVFILIDVLVIGLLAPAIYRHARAHFKPTKQPELGQPTEVSAAVKARLLKEAEAKFTATLTHSVEQLQHNLDGTTNDINNLIKKLAVEMVNKELQKYKEGLVNLHEQAQKDFSGFKQTMDGHEAELKAKLAAEMKTEQDRLVKQIDTKLGDAVSSFLLETLQHNVDLGSQGAYLMSVLEEHKADFVKEVGNENTAT